MRRSLRRLALAGRWVKHQVRRQPLRHLTIEVTKRCNARCEFCDYWREKPGTELADYGPLVRRFDPLAITLSGGEPLLRRDLEEVIRGIRRVDAHVHVGMVTNGALLSVERAAALRAAGLNQLSISLDYPDERHDRARGIPGLAAKVAALGPRIAGLGFDLVTFNTVLKDDNLECVPAILALARSSGLRVGFSAYCDLKTGRQDLLVAEGHREKLRETVALIREAKRRDRISPVSDYYLDHLEEYFAAGKIPGCEAGIRWVQVTPAGQIKPCSELPVAAEDWRDYEPRRAAPVTCTRCWYSCRGESQAPVTWRRVRELVG